ncbi:hypothetical protein E4U14_006735 [Claviceps sp. LM454 group G7]|nr:hypothetical protein E4U14_006735 [Claviceps sp. LM454 group G7]
MADLIEEERRIILDNPLGHSLDSVHAQGEAFDDERSDPWLEAVSELVIALYASRACRWLASKIEKRRHLPSNLGDICTRLKKHELPVQVVRPLSQLVLNQASDIEIWTAVIAVVATLNKDTPSTYQPLSWSPFEDTATKAEAEVFDEICNSTHCAVGGFHQKHFEGHECNSRAKEVWQRAKHLYSDSEKKWLHLLLQPTEENVCSWWLGLQNDCLATEQAAYFGRPVQYEDGSDSEDYGSDSEHCGPVFDRSGPYSGATFNVHEEPEKFAQVLCGYLMMGDEGLGLDVFTEEKDGRQFVTMPVNERGAGLTQLELNLKPLSYRRAIVSSATTCFPAKPIGATEFDRVVKYSWTPSTWTPEADLLRKANEHRVQGVAKLVGYEREITRISKLRDGLTFSTPHKDQIPYDDRVLRVLAVTPLGRPLKELESILELLECLRDAIKAHRSLYMESGIIHGDISVNNIIMTEPAKADGYKGMLIDLDLARDIIKDPCGQRHRTGTIEFMAIEVLLGQQHTYRHDLESFLYVFMWLCSVYGAKGKGREPIDALPRSWSKGSLNLIAQLKLGHMVGAFYLLMKRFPAECGERVKQFIATIRDILFTVPNGVEVEPCEYVPEEPDAMYGPILEAFEKTIREIRQEG